MGVVENRIAEAEDEFPVLVKRLQGSGLTLTQGAKGFYELFGPGGWRLFIMPVTRNVAIDKHNGCAKPPFLRFRGSGSRTLPAVINAVLAAMEEERDAVG